MAYHEKNENGRIRIGRAVVESVCARVIDGFEGRVLVSDPKGHLKQRGGASLAEEERGFARARFRDGNIDIKLYLIVQFGTSMREIAAAIGARIMEEFPMKTKIDVGLVTMVFVGTLAEKLSKRNIVFEYDGILREISGDE